MLKELQYPFDAEYIIKKKKRIKKELLAADGRAFVDKKIAILGGQTTQNIKLLMELFLLDQGIRPTFWETEYDRWYEDGLFGNDDLNAFSPDVIYICTCVRNIAALPMLSDDKAAVDELLLAEEERFTRVWEQLEATFHCPVIQNNFEYPYFRLLGNADASDMHGRVNYVTRLNLFFAEYADAHANFHICDVNYISSTYGLDRWSDPYYWHMYKYAVAVPAIPYLAKNVANIIKSIYGKNKKAFNLDLDNTLWGGIVGDDGAENIEIGQETPLGQTFQEFQEYLKLHRQMGILLTVNSKNEEETALSGLNRPDSVLTPENFVSIKANWNPKSENLKETADELSLLPESFVFVDDNPAERAMIEGTFSDTPTPVMDKVENYIRIIDRSGFFEVTGLSEDDLKREGMYRENAKRTRAKQAFTDYNEYLRSLEMEAEIDAFSQMYLSRIAQLTNKSNQFNLTTKRYSLSEIEEAAQDADRITQYGKLKDKFGDNGVVSVAIGRIDGEKKEELHIELWLMSCRVLKRDMEVAMLDTLIARAKAAGIERIYGYYYPTAKNAMVKDFYGGQGFSKISEDADGNAVWSYEIPAKPLPRQDVIKIEGTKE